MFNSKTVIAVGALAFSTCTFVLIFDDSPVHAHKVARKLSRHLQRL